MNVKNLFAAFAALMLFSFSSVTHAVDEPWRPIPGKKYEYARGQTFHIELRPMYATKEATEDAFRDYFADPKHQGHKEVAYMYLVSKRARDNMPGYAFANCGLRADIRVDGIRDAAKYKNAEFPVLNRNRVMVGTVKPTGVGASWMEFKNFQFADGGPTNIVIPYAFEGKPVMTIVPLNWRGTGRFHKGGRYTMEFGHRMDNPGFIPEMFVFADSVKDRCRPA